MSSSSRRLNTISPLWRTSSVSALPYSFQNILLFTLSFLDYITKDNCTVEHVTPLVEELKVVLTGCIADLHALVGVDVNLLLLTSVGVKVTVAVLARLVADILIVSLL